MYIQGETFINLSYLTINANSILQYYQDNMLFDLITAGLLTNELLREYSHIVTDQMRAINLLYRHFLPPTLLAPQDLQVILSKMVQSLENTSIYEVGI